MDLLPSAEVQTEMKERKKIQFSVPSVAPTQLDPHQLEMIRRRRPTPATLFRISDQLSPEEESTSHQLAVIENGVVKPKANSASVYEPPSLKAVQRIAQACMQALGASNTVGDYLGDSPASESESRERQDKDSLEDYGSEGLKSLSGHEITAKDVLHTIGQGTQDTQEEQEKGERIE